jgi:hypothetical protein
MHAEAGQDIGSIVSRKEAERRAGDGLFFWGVGNAPSRSIRALASEAIDIDVVFSLMKSRPHARDTSPTGIVVWGTYLDSEGIERAISEHALVISREQSSTRNKSAHYALVCRSDEELRLRDLGAFDPKAYRNIGDGGGPIGSSQVTALVVRTRAESPVSLYRINLRAKLAGSYWVRLCRPRPLKGAALATLAEISARAAELTTDEWTRAVAGLRGCPEAAVERQLSLF